MEPASREAPSLGGQERPIPRTERPMEPDALRLERNGVRLRRAHEFCEDQKVLAPAERAVTALISSSP